MRIAIFGDIHANLEGLEAVLADAKEQGCDSHICMGDVVGYNANPAECLEIVRDLNCPVVKGNHDLDCGFDTSLEMMNPVAAEALQWTREQLAPDQRQWLARLRMVRQVHDFTIVHSTLDQPNSWNYVTNRFDAMANFFYQVTPVCFYGHTHVPRVFARTNNVLEVPAEEVEIEPNVKYFINTGSVGQPRDGDWRASYCIYDMDAKRVIFRRLEYDLEAAQKKIIAAGLPEMLAERLAFGR
ncbi:metallophosphoesterase family protein [Persicirhabdus sediminis]|uniref:Metallophosphoesterase family protein n=1 Tax=Persicirhabdus sediminis TaxID=454144 RepID=A0A8J7SHJ6_9BACT|nr:metallophosphoesterase family protein [Persicirhabdus sediminis]MBK1789866.1 metallophosphoesterase family protein [Persicirhabdus sediminis]